MKKTLLWLIGVVGLIGLALPYALAVSASANDRDFVAQFAGPPGTIITVAGNGQPGFSGDGGSAINASLNFPIGVTTDRAGNIFVADRNNNRIRRIDANSKIITTVAGSGFTGFNGDGGPATSARLNTPLSLVVDSAGNIYIVDSFNNRIRRVDAATGLITTFAGNGLPTFGGDGGPATDASLNPSAIAIDSAGNLYIADTVNGRIRKVDAATRIITTVAGGGTPATGIGDGGAATSARLGNPDGVAVDRAGNIYIADKDNARIRRVDAATGIITTVAGNGKFGFSGDGGVATSASILLPAGLAVDSAGNIFFADTSNNRVRRVDAATNIITTVAGNGQPALSGNGGLATSASLNFPVGIALDSAGNLYIADGHNNQVRVVLAQATTGGADFNLALSPAAQTIIAGRTTSFTVNVNSLNGFTQPVNLSAALNPSNSGATLSLSTSTVTPGNSATLTVNSTASAVPGTYAITLTGTSGQIVNSAVASLKINAAGQGDFTLAINPSTLNINAGETASINLTTQAIGGLAETITLTRSLTPAAQGLTINSSAETLTPGAGATLNITAANDAVQNNYTLTITGTTASGLTQTATAQINVLPPSIPFSIAFSQPTVTIARRAKAQITVNITRLAGFTGNVTITPNGSTLQQLKIKSKPSSVTASGATAVFTLKAKATAVTGTQQLTFSAQDEQGRTTSNTLTVVIQ